MKYYLIIGTLLFILVLSLALDIFLNIEFFNGVNENKEGFQGFSKSQVIDMSQCTTLPYDNACKYFKYYDASQTIHDGYFRNIPSNVYIDNDNILQPIPYGYKASDDYRSYVLKNPAGDYAYSENQKEKQNLVDSAITTPDICNPSDKDYRDITKCFGTQYVVIVDGNPVKKPAKLRVPAGYYIDTSKDKKGILTKIPFGYIGDPNNKYMIQMTNEFSSNVNKTKYDINTQDVTYHDYPEESKDESSAGPGKMWILNNSGELVAVPFAEVSNNTLYQPGSFRFGSSNYVPNYEESVYLSKLTNITTTTPYIDASTMGGGFCEYYKTNPDKLEELCNDTSANTCGSTSCCVLLGGQKCVYGDSQGPHFKSNYSNFQVTNPEFYYYQGKCYGKCM